MTDPAWAHERVLVVDPDPGWPARAAAAVELLTPVLGPWLSGPVEHVGSTSVPGLPAKPVIDLAARVTDLDAGAQAVCRELRDRNWHLVPPELDGRPGRRFLVRSSADGRHRREHLHLTSVSDRTLDDELTFRDALRADPSLRQRYATLKRTLAERHPSDREAYTDAKTAFVATALAAGGTVGPCATPRRRTAPPAGSHVDVRPPGPPTGSTPPRRR